MKCSICGLSMYSGNICPRCSIDSRREEPRDRALLAQMAATIAAEDVVRIARVIADELRAPSRLPRFLSSAEAARVAGVTQKTIRAWVKRGDLRDYWAGNDLRIRLDDLLAYLGRKRGDDVLDIEDRVASIMGGHG